MSFAMQGLFMLLNDVLLLVFWIESSTDLSDFLQEALLSLSMYPGSIYPAQVRLLLFTAIPVGFVVYIPASLVRGFEWRLLALLAVYAALCSRLAWLVFQRGLRRYESGNLMAGRF